MAGKTVIERFPKVPQVILNKRLQDFPQYREYNMLSSEVKQLLSHLEGKEVQFPVPWGFIAGREYGDPNGVPTLALHGWLDNCGSFEPLLPYIVKANNLHVIALDEPGCGLSSHKGVGASYSRWSFLKDIKKILSTLKWEKVTLLGHSQGGHYAFIFASLYPNLVDRVISIDIEKPISCPTEAWREKIQKIIEKQIQVDDLYCRDPSLESTAPIYSESDALKRLMEAHGYSLNERSAKIMLKRGSKPFKSGITFSRDIRQKLPDIVPLPTDDTILQLMQGIKCDLLIIRGSKSIYTITDEARNRFYALYKEKCPIFSTVSLTGTHHLHMNDPDVVGPIINSFLAKSLATCCLKSDAKSNL